MANKATFTLDEATIRRLESVSERLKMPKSQVVRKAVANFHDSIGRLDERERQRQLQVIRELVPTIPKRPQKDVEKELADIRNARRAGGRGGTRRGVR
jgi:predicted transcriptional regulator